MFGQRILYGLARLPTSLPPSDPRLPGIVLEGVPLRLNNYKVPPAVMAADPSGHLARLEAVSTWLHAACGDYGGQQRAFVDAYLAFVANRLHGERQVLATQLSRFDGLYAVEDWTWSALRPLPRAWVPAPGGGYASVGLALWTGSILLVTERKAEGLPGTECICIEALRDASPPAMLDRFWEGQVIPATPFGRGLPALLPG